MAFFQNSVLNKHLQGQDTEKVETAYQKFTSYFHNPAIQQNIRDAKEEQFQEGFLRELFVDILGYTLNPKPDYNLTTELKNEKGSKKADGAILTDGKALGVIELKGTNTKDLEKINEQAFNYKNNQTGCIYVITSNFEKLRFFIHNAVEHIEFNLFTLSLDEFKVLWLCLNVDNLLSGVPLTLKEESLLAEENITKQLYKDYSAFKTDMWRNMSKNHPQGDQLMLFRKTQKLLDRFLFIFFAEDSGLLPPNSISKIIEKWKHDTDWGEDKKLYDIYKQYFGFINSGRPARGDRAEIFGYNGGLFQDDLILDNIKIDDEILLTHTEKLTAYDFQSEVDVNILGHIFENSLTEIETITAELEGQQIDKSKSKRKKDGVFYTPKYITKYIVDNTIGKLCEEKKAELNISDERFGQSGKRSKKGIADLQTYRDWLLDLKICDPACGSGAFLNQALDFLIEEHQYLDELTAHYHKTPLVLSDIETQILEQNIYGVDINEESVEIAKLSLWLRTAQRGRKLTSLNNNIKCGNSLIDDPEVAGEKAFNWQKEFPDIFVKKEKRAWHLTWVTHDTRTSKRMIKYKVRERRADGEMHVDRSIILEENEAIKVTEFISQIVLEDKLNCLAYNICNDHVHMLLVCEEDELDNTVRKLKGKSAQKFKEFRSIPKDETFHLWAQKYNKTPITSDEQLYATIKYINNNRQKHELPDISNGLQPIVQNMICDITHAFRTEYKGGFDVVIGNPPYVDIKVLDNDIVKYLFEKFQSANNRVNLYSSFIERSIDLLNKNKYFSFIIPSSLLTQESYKELRKLLLAKTTLTNIIRLPNESFGGSAGEVKVDTIILSLKTNIDLSTLTEVFIYKGFDRISEITTYNADIHFLINPFNWKKDESFIFRINVDNETMDVVKKCEVKTKKLIDCADFCLGLTPYDKYRGHTQEQIKDRVFHATYQKDETFNKLLAGNDITRYHVEWGGTEWISYGDWLGAPREPRFFKNKRILVKQIIDWTDKRIWAAISSEELYNTQNAFNLIAKDGIIPEYLIALLNSKLISFYHRKKFLEEYKDRFQKILIKDAKEFPIKQVPQAEQNQFVDAVKKIVTSTNTLQKSIVAFNELIQSKFELEKLSTKLQNWHKLEFKDFLKELKKAKIQLSLTEEAEWMQYFNEQKYKAQELKAEINTVDAEIDRMVYELYGLTEEEIKIVENQKN